MHTLYIYRYTVSTCKELRPIYDAIRLHVMYVQCTCINRNVCITKSRSRTLHMMCRIE